MQVIWGPWNRAHITRHGGTAALAEQLLAIPGLILVPQSPTLATITGVVDGRSWTLVFGREPADASEPVAIYPITMYPTRRGGRKHRRRSTP